MHFEKCLDIIEYSFIMKIEMREIPLILYYLMVGVIWLFALAWLISHFDKEKNNIKSEQDEQKIKKLKLDMPWRKFEEQIAECFFQRWWKKNLWPWEADDGKDIVVGKDWKIFLIQCKHWFWDWIVRPEQIRGFQWAIDLYNQKNHKNAKWIFITSWKTTDKARETAYHLWIHLWDKYNWKRKVQTFEG